MTRNQEIVIAQLNAEGFEAQNLANIVKLKRGADVRIVRQDGSVIRDPQKTHKELRP